MAKKLILAVAGSGKTTEILKSIDDNKKSLIITYTNENLRSIETGIIKKYGHIPENITVLTYFSFLYRFCIQPYFSYELHDNSFTWNIPPRFPAWKKNDIRHYLTNARYLYANRAAKLIIEFDVINDINNRLTRHFDHFFVDEVQDFAANDFNLLLGLSKANLEVMFVGDFFQHTFDTSRDGKTRENLHKKGLEEYLKEFRKTKFHIDTTSLDKTYRCSPSICNFISDQIGIPISSHRQDDTNIHFIKDEKTALQLCNEVDKVTLFYQGQAKYDCHSNNWGRSKGLNSYGDVCIALNLKTLQKFMDEKLNELPEATRNKLYVACSRARGDLYLFDERLIKSLICF